MSRIEKDCRPIETSVNPWSEDTYRVIPKDVCVESRSMDADVWEALELACGLNALTQNDSDGNWYISSAIFKDRPYFCVSQALCKVENSFTDSDDGHFVLDALGGDYQVETSDADNPVIIGQIADKLEACGFKTVDPELLKYFGATNYFTFGAERAGKIFAGLKDSANMCIADEAGYFLGKVFENGAADNGLAKLALVNAKFDEALAQNKPIAADVLPMLLEVFNNPQKCDATSLTALIIPYPTSSEDRLKNYVVNKAIRAVKIQPQQEAPPPPPVTCGKKAHVDPDNNQHCLCDEGYVSKNDDTGDCKPIRAGGGGKKKPAAGGKKYNPFEE